MHLERRLKRQDAKDAEEDTEGLISIQRYQGRTASAAPDCPCGRDALGKGLKRQDAKGAEEDTEGLISNSTVGSDGLGRP